MSEEGEVKGNIFVGDDLDGIDNINYAGIADEKSYEEVMKLENIPEGFHKVKITFRAEDNVDIVQSHIMEASVNLIFHRFRKKMVTMQSGRRIWLENQ